MLTVDTTKPYRIFAEHLEPEALRQFEQAMQLESTVRGALMPDAHTGYTLPIGAVIATQDWVYPSFVGYDIGCGMCAQRVSVPVAEVRSKAREIFDEIYRRIPVGFAHNQRPADWPLLQDKLPMSDKLKEIFERDGLCQLGSLGGGNHFIEIGEAQSDGSVWIVIHSGSRGIGHAVATHYMRLASGDGKAREGFYGFNVGTEVLGHDYLWDQSFCLQFALANRGEMMRRVINILVELGTQKPGGPKLGPLINRNHNHVELRDGLWIHRKGATHAEKDMWGVIPGNMRDGSFIVQGLGNPESLYSSSHGAGRQLGRKAAKATLNMTDFQQALNGVTARVTENTLDEAPQAYKDIFAVMRLQDQLVTVKEHIQPIINIKG